MSSDFLDDVEDNKGNVVLLNINVSGFAELTIMEPEGNIVSLQLTPDKTGWSNAIKIVNALKHWVEHTKETQGA